MDNLVALVDILGCRFASLPMTYLGMPFGAHFKVVSMWNPILEMERKLSGWKRLYFSMVVDLLC